MRYYISIHQPGGMGGSFGRTIEDFDVCDIDEYEWKSCVTASDHLGVINTWLVETSEEKMCLFLLRVKSTCNIIAYGSKEFQNEEKFQNFVEEVN